MSSLNDVIVIPFATFGSATNVPAPRRRVRWPSRTSSSSAARTVRRETPRSDAEQPLGRDRVADLERLDQLEHLVADLALLRHRGPILYDVAASSAAAPDAARRDPRAGVRIEEVEPLGIDCQPDAAADASRPSARRRAP